MRNHGNSLRRMSVMIRQTAVLLEMGLLTMTLAAPGAHAGVVLFTNFGAGFAYDTTAGNLFFFSCRRRHTSCLSDWSSDVCSSDLTGFNGFGSGGTNWYQNDSTHQLAEQISWAHGSHNVMAGAEFRRLATGRAAVNSARGTFTLDRKSVV